MDSIFTALEQRSSTRAYTDEPLTQAELETLLKAGLQAPTATNRQEIHITVVDGADPLLAQIEAEKNALGGAGDRPDNFYYDAPVVLFLSGDAAFSWSAVDAGIAVENIALAAQGLGLGSVIIGCVKKALTGPRAAAFGKALDFPEGYAFEIAIAVGHKATEKAPHAYSMDKNVSRI